MAGFDYLIDSEYSGAPGNSFLFNFLQIFAGGTIVFVSCVVPYVRTLLGLVSDEGEVEPTNNTLLSRDNDGGNDVSPE